MMADHAYYTIQIMSSSFGLLRYHILHSCRDPPRGWLDSGPLKRMAGLVSGLSYESKVYLIFQTYYPICLYAVYAERMQIGRAHV